jgi:hypothetical protein
VAPTGYGGGFEDRAVGSSLHDPEAARGGDARRGPATRAPAAGWLPLHLVAVDPASDPARAARPPSAEGGNPKQQRFKRYPIGFFRMDIAEGHAAEGGLYLFVGIGRTSKFGSRG